MGKGREVRPCPPRLFTSEPSCSAAGCIAFFRLPSRVIAAGYFKRFLPGYAQFQWCQAARRSYASHAMLVSLLRLAAGFQQGWVKFHGSLAAIKEEADDDILPLPANNVASPKVSSQPGRNVSLRLYT